MVTRQVHWRTGRRTEAYRSAGEAQVGEDLPDDRRPLDDGDDFHPPTTFYFLSIMVIKVVSPRHKTLHPAVKAQLSCSLFFTGIFEYYQSIDTFKVNQEKLGEIIVELVPNADFRDEHWIALKKEILEKGDPDLKIELKIVREGQQAPAADTEDGAADAWRCAGCSLRRTRPQKRHTLA